MGEWSKWVRAGVCGLLGLLGTACSSGDSGGPPVSLDQFPQQFASAYCDTIAPCCTKAEIPYSDPYTTYDAAAAGNCLAALKQAMQACKSPDSGLENSACGEIFKGSLANGTACTQSVDCVSGYCRLDSDGVTRACADPSSPTAAQPAHGKAGDACGGDCFESTTTFSGVSTSQMLCEETNIAVPHPALPFCYASEGVHCSPASETCEAFPALGGACPDGVCGTGAYCDSATLVCTAPHDSGPCQFSQECSAKSYCDELTRQCLAKKPDGYSCSSDDECVNALCSAQTSTTSQSATAICGPLPAATPDTCSGLAL
jgi:hypothetical protein